MKSIDPADRSPDFEERIDQIVAGYLDRLNGGEILDPDEIRQEHPDHAEDVIERLEVFRTLDDGADIAAAAPGVLGDYTLRRQLGRGGMGVVYEAWQSSLDRRVALKVLPAGLAADHRTFLRFMNEAKAAAQLSHPNVVAVHGMGVEQNTPYFAMEYVEGETLAQVLRAVGAVGPDAETSFGQKDSLVYFSRLGEAFAEVADGLQHAHSRKVIHRDIKPSNIILDRAGRLRILDFGLARLEGQESLTLSGDVVGTPQYMSPEQARRRRISVDHRTDVYSLGATLYEALCGRPPFQGEDHADTLSQIIGREPVEPKRVNDRVPKDLETIVLKCLRKEPGDRYGTAEALAQDLRRFVRADPIEARPQTRLERLVAGLWRRRWMLGAASLVLLAAFVGLAVTTLVIAEKERRTQAALGEARESFHSAHRAVESFLTVVAEGELPLVPGQEKLRRKLLENALDFYQKALEEKGSHPFLIEESAKASMRVAKVYARLGDAESARHASSHALDLALELASARPDFDSRALLRDAYSRLGLDHVEGGRVDEGRTYLEKAIEVQKGLAQDFPLSHKQHHDLASLLNDLAITHVGRTFSGWQTREDIERALDLFGQAAKEERAFLDAVPAHAEGRFLLSMQLGNLGAALELLGDPSGSEAHQREGLDLLRQLVLESPEKPEYRARLASHALSLGILLQFDLGHPLDAEALYRETLEVQEKLTKDFAETPNHRSDLGALLNNLAQILMARGELTEAGSMLERAVREQEAAVKASPAQPDYRVRLVQHLSNLADVRDREGRHGDAEGFHRRLIATQEALVMDFPRSSRLASDLASHVRSYARHLARAGSKEEAARAYEKAVGLFEKLEAALPGVLENRLLLAESLREVAQLAIDGGNLLEACNLLQRCVEAQEAGIEEGRKGAEQREVLGDYLISHGQALARAGRPGEAESALQRAIELFRSLVREKPEIPGFREKVESARTELAIALMKDGRTAEGDALYRDALSSLERFVAEHSGSGQFQNHFGDALQEYSGILLGRGDLAGARDFALKAVRRFQEGVKLRPGYARYEVDLRNGHAFLAGILERVGDHRGAAEQAGALAGAMGAGPEDLYRAALIRARAARLARDDATLAEGERGQAVEDHASGAVELLRQAIGKGLGDPGRLRTAEELVGLRGERTLEEFLDTLEAGSEGAAGDGFEARGGQP